jgi:hypothetical protein
VASAVPQANGEAPPLPHRRAHTPLPLAKSPSPYPAANGEVATDSPADVVKAEPTVQGTPHVSCCGRQSSSIRCQLCVNWFAFGTGLARCSLPPGPPQTQTLYPKPEP